MLFIVVVAQMFCTIASVTSASRMMFAFSRDRAVPGHQLWRRVSKADRVPVYTVLGDLRARVRADDPDALERIRRLRRRHADLGDRPVHRVHPAGHPAPEGRGLVPAGRLEPRPLLQAGRLGRRSSGSPSSRSCSSCRSRPPASRGTRASPGTSSTTRAARGRRLPPLRRLVRPLGAQVVQGPGRAWAPRKSSSAIEREYEPGPAAGTTSPAS